MRIHSAEFAGAIGQVGQAMPAAARGVPQVAFAGRSNVGKSSLINRILGRTRTPIARVSGEPGKTQEINFYRVITDGGEFFLTDLPGYGYARVPRELRGRWEPLIRAFLTNTEELAGVVQLIDARRPPTPDDLRSVEFLGETGIPALFVLTKSDKLNRSGLDRAVHSVTASLGVETDQVLTFSSLNGAGREELLDAVGGLVFPARTDSA